MSKRNPESGAVLIFFLLTIGVMVSILALVIDIGRLEALARSLQHTADAASVAAATALSVSDLDIVGENGEARRYANTKKTVLLILAQGEMMGLDSTAKASLVSQTMRFNTSTGANNTAPDWPNYGFDTAEAGNLRVRMRRQLHCFSGTDASPTRTTYELDEDPNMAFCRANQVTVEITVSNIPTFFGKFLGRSEFMGVTRTATSFMHERIPDSSTAICESTNCSALGISFSDLSYAANCNGLNTP